MRTWEQRAKASLPSEVYEFFAGGAGDEVTLARSEQAWQDIELRPRVLRDVTHVDTSVTVLGERLVSPIAIAPTGYQSLAHPDAEVAVAAAAAASNTLLAISSRSTTGLHEVTAVSGDSPRWFQVYVLRDRDKTAELVDDAVLQGCRAIVLTADAPILGRRPRDVRNGLVLPATISSDARSGLPELQNGAMAQDPSTSFADIKWLAEISGLPVVVKGVLRGDDAQRCVDAGAAAIWVSAHGGRQLDGALTPARALPEIVNAVGDRTEVYVDGGIRSGVDVLRAVALGARAAFVGRPILWGLATNGESGVKEVLHELNADFRLGMALTGAGNCGEVTSDLLVS